MKRFACVMLALLLALGVSVAHAEQSPTVDPFGFRVLRDLYSEHGQVVFSPMSLRVALNMAAEGAAYETRDEILAVLGQDAPRAQDVSAFPEVKIANAAMVSDKIKLAEQYRTLLTSSYDAEVFPFAEDIVKQINDWVKLNTDGMIETLLNEPPDAMIRLILLNALTLDAKWQIPFLDYNTNEGVFHAPDGDVTIEFMHEGRAIPYAEADGVQAAKLNYENERLEMLLLLPEAGGMKALLDRLADEGTGFLGAFRYPDAVYLALPKVSIESKFSLNEILYALGIEAAFNLDVADFSGITESERLFIDSIMQEARIDVDEEGTRAAAVTSIAMAGAGMVEEVVEMQLDRPYVMLVRDNVDGTVFFATVVENPTSNSTADETLDGSAYWVDDTEEVHEKPNQQDMTLDDVRVLAQKGDELLMEDIDQFLGANLSSQMDYVIKVYTVDQGYHLVVHSNKTGKPDSVNLESIWEAGGTGIDIRYGDLDAFLNEWPIVMQFKPNTQTPTGASFTLKNHTDKEYTFGEQYVLQQRDHGDWIDLDIVIDNYAFNDIGYLLEPNGAAEFDVDWAWLYGEIPAGEYRLVKEANYIRSPGDFDTHQLYAEFNITDTINLKR